MNELRNDEDGIYSAYTSIETLMKSSPGLTAQVYFDGATYLSKQNAPNRVAVDMALELMERVVKTHDDDVRAMLVAGFELTLPMANAYLRTEPRAKTGQSPPVNFVYEVLSHLENVPNKMEGDVRRALQALVGVLHDYVRDEKEGFLDEHDLAKAHNEELIVFYFTPHPHRPDHFMVGTHDPDRFVYN